MLFCFIDAVLLSLFSLPPSKIKINVSRALLYGSFLSRFLCLTASPPLSFLLPLFPSGPYLHPGVCPAGGWCGLLTAVTHFLFAHGPRRRLLAATAFVVLRALGFLQQGHPSSTTQRLQQSLAALDKRWWWPCTWRRRTCRRCRPRRRASIDSLFFVVPEQTAVGSGGAKGGGGDDDVGSSGGGILGAGHTCIGRDESAGGPVLGWMAGLSASQRAEHLKRLTQLEVAKQPLPHRSRGGAGGGAGGAGAVLPPATNTLATDAPVTGAGAAPVPGADGDGGSGHGGGLTARGVRRALSHMATALLPLGVADLDTLAPEQTAAWFYDVQAASSASAASAGAAPGGGTPTPAQRGRGRRRRLSDGGRGHVRGERWDGAAYAMRDGQGARNATCRVDAAPPAHPRPRGGAHGARTRRAPPPRACRCGLRRDMALGPPGYSRALVQGGTFLCL